MKMGIERSLKAAFGDQLVEVLQVWWAGSAAGCLSDWHDIIIIICVFLWRSGSVLAARWA